MESSLVHNLMSITMLGTEWILWLLIAMSFLSVSIMIERAVYHRRSSLAHFPAFLDELSRDLSAREFTKARSLCLDHPSVEGRVALTAIDNIGLEPEAMERLVASRMALERKAMDRGLTILGTLGNNTPFIGLFGTVIGIIQAFHALAQNTGGGSAVVMSGISEALISTAAGLVVAIPAVIAFNTFQKMAKNRLLSAEILRELIMAHAVQASAQLDQKAS